MESKYGKKLLETKTSGGQLFKQRLGIILVALFLIAFGIVQLMNPDTFTFETFEGKIILAMCFVTGPILLIAAIFRIKASQAIIYENGFVLAKGSKATEFSFEQLKGISDNKTIAKYLQVLAVASSRELVIESLNGEKTKLGKSKGFGAAYINALIGSLANFEQFADELTTVFTKYLLKGITKENLSNANISFGDSLELANGRLIYQSPKGKADIALDAIGHIKVAGGEGSWLSIEGRSGEELASIRADKALNLEALYKIVEMSRK